MSGNHLDTFFKISPVYARMTSTANRPVHRWRKDLTASSASTLIVLATNFIFTFMTARILGVESRGELSLVSVLATQVAIASNIGLNLSIVYYGLNQRRTWRIFTIAIAINATMAAALTLLILNLFGHNETLAAIGAALTAASVIRLNGVAAIRANGMTTMASLLLASAPILSLAGVGAISTYDRVGVVSILNILLGASLSTGLIALSLVAHRTDKIFHNGSASVSSTLGKLYRFGARGHISTLLQAISYRLDVLVIYLISGPAAVANYTIAVTCAELVLLPANSAGPVIISSIRSEMDRSDVIIHTARRSSAMLFLAGLLLGVPLLSVSLPIAIGPGFSQVPLLFAILLFATLVLAEWKNLANRLTGMGRPAARTRSSLLGAITSVSLLVPAVLIIGPFGAAAVSLLSYGCSAIYLKSIAKGED